LVYQGRSDGNLAGVVQWDPCWGETNNTNVGNFEGFPLDRVSVGNMMNPVLSRVLSFIGGSFQFRGNETCFTRYHVEN